MIRSDLPEIARRHCAADRHRLSVKGFVSTNYGVGHQFFSKVATGKKRPSRKLLNGMANAHHRLFPGEAMLVKIPNHPDIVLGDSKNLHRTTK